MKSSQNPVLAYFKSAFEEFRKVTWPTKEQAALLTGIVIGVSLVIGVYLGLLDLGLSQGYQALLKLVPQSSTSDTTSGATTGTTLPTGTFDVNNLPDGVSVETQPAGSTDSSSTDSSSQQ